MQALCQFNEKAVGLLTKPDGSYFPAALEALQGLAKVMRATRREARAAEIEAKPKTVGRQRP